MGDSFAISHSRQRATRMARVGQAAQWCLIAVGLFAYARIFQNTYIDDTYITLQYVRNLADHLGWGFFPGQTTNTATSPLNVIVLAAFAKVTGSALTAVAVAMAIEWTLTLAVLLGIPARSPAPPTPACLPSPFWRRARCCSRRSGWKAPSSFC